MFELSSSCARGRDGGNGCEALKKGEKVEREAEERSQSVTSANTQQVQNLRPNNAELGIAVSADSSSALAIDG